MGRLAFIGILLYVCLSASAAPPDPAPPTQSKTSPGSSTSSASQASGVKTTARPERGFSTRSWREWYLWRENVISRAYDVRPSRRDRPARYENISDEEVREIQIASREYVPRALVNIGTVVTGCPCEDGVGCGEQVWVVASNNEGSYSLQLSRIERRWTVGPVQRWWRRWDRLDSKQFPTFDEFRRAEDALLSEFPACAKTVPLVTANTPS